jgi:protein-S-isoprenylcysteine O-methyltransferase Ste14
MYTLIIQGVCVLVWLLFLYIWYRSGEVYEVRRRGSTLIPVPLLIIALFVVSFMFPFGWAFLPLAIAGLVIQLIGFLFSQWAKGVLGTNWSSGNAIMVNHELATEMPYSIVRHPVYFAILIMCLGSSLIFGSLTMFGATLVIGLIFAGKAYMEEGILKEELGQEYIDYQEGVPFLLPGFLWRGTGLFKKSDNEVEL